MQTVVSAGTRLLKGLSQLILITFWVDRVLNRVASKLPPFRTTVDPAAKRPSGFQRFVYGRDDERQLDRCS
jgi:hypothetical protein